MVLRDRDLDSNALYGKIPPVPLSIPGSFRLVQVLEEVAPMLTQLLEELQKIYLIQKSLEFNFQGASSWY